MQEQQQAAQRYAQENERHETVRPLGSSEHLFWLLDQNRPTHFAMVAEINRQFPPGAWHAAFLLLQQRHPLLSTSISGDAQIDTCFRHMTGATIPLRVVERQDAAWQAEVAGELATRFDPSTAPLVRAVLLQREHQSTLILVAHHSVLDGKGSTFLIEDLLRTLSGEALASLPLVHPLETILKDEVAAAPPLPAAPLAPTPKALRPGGAEVPHVDGLALTPELTRRLVTRARIERTTVHGAIAAAIHEAGRRLSAQWCERPLRTLTPIDTRHLADQIGTASGVYISQALTVDDHPRGASFWDVARQIKSDIAPAQTKEAALADLKDLQATLSTKPAVQHISGFLSAVMAFDLLLSNLGNQPVASTFGDLKLNALWGPCVTSGIADDQVVGVCTIDGVLRLTHASYASIPALLDVTQRVLEAAVVTQAVGDATFADTETSSV